jgi:outer membrane receptor protein involved in Fe transport
MYNSDVSPYLAFLGQNLLPVGYLLQGSESFSNVSPEATLSWHPRQETTLYGAYKTGFKSGGYSSPSVLAAPATVTAANYAFKPEKASGAEIGFKGRFRDGTVQVTTAIYDYKFKDLQESEFDSATISFSTQNAAVATTRGIESDISWQASAGLNLRASLNYNRGRFASFNNAPCFAGQTSGCSAAGTQNLSGARLPYSSDWTEVLGFTWDRPVSPGYRLSLGSDVQYLSPVNSSAQLSSNANYGPIWLIGANLGLYADERDTWRLELIGRNLLNEHYITVSIDRTAAPPGSTDQYGPINRPREIWLQVSRNFGYR